MGVDVMSSTNKTKRSVGEGAFYTCLPSSFQLSGGAFKKSLVLTVCMLVLGSASMAKVVENDVFSEIVLQAPLEAGDREYLGIDGLSFTIQEIATDLLVFEIVGVYCPVCHRQAPLLCQLANRLHRDPSTKGRVKVVAFVSGATEMEIEYLKKEFKAPFPIIYERDFTMHKILGSPKTPSMFILQGSEVVYTHRGMIKDMDGLFKRIQGLLP
jgi:thiol-disulfide isomerase/thioredoxin